MAYDWSRLSSRLVITLALVPVAIGIVLITFKAQDCSAGGTPCNTLLTVEEVKRLTGANTSTKVRASSSSCSAIFKDSFDQEIAVVEIERDDPDPHGQNYSSKQTLLRSLASTFEPLAGFDAEAFAVRVPAFEEILLQRPADGVRGAVQISITATHLATPFPHDRLKELVPIVGPRLAAVDDWLRRLPR